MTTPEEQEMESVSFEAPYGSDPHLNAFRDYSHLRFTSVRAKDDVHGPRFESWALVTHAPRATNGDTMKSLTPEQAKGALLNFFLQQANKTKPEPDLLAILSAHRWRLDCRYQTGEYRVLYHCAECRLWRPVVNTGEFFPNARQAITTAAQFTSVTDECPEQRDSQAWLLTGSAAMRDGLCPRDGAPCEKAGDGARCCEEPGEPTYK